MSAHHPEGGLPTETPPASLAMLRFHGMTACGVLALALAREAGRAGPVTGAEQVLCLAQAEPLICAVEQWLGCAWDPSPAGVPDARAGYLAVVRDPALAPPGTTLAVPLPALRLPPPDALRGPALTWGAHTVRVRLSAVPAEALPQLQPGALLWLPASFGADWPVQLFDPAGQLPLRAARFDVAAQRLTLASASASAPEAEAVAEPAVVLRRAVQLPLDHWLGWDDTPFHWPVPQPWTAELHVGHAVSAHGALLPVGAGCGLRIDAPAAAPVA